MFVHVVDHALRTHEVTLSFLIARFHETDVAVTSDALCTGARLYASGLLQRQRGSWSSERVAFTFSSRLAEAMLVDVEDVEGLVSLLFPATPPPETERRDVEGLRGSCPNNIGLVGEGDCRGDARCELGAPHSKGRASYMILAK